MTNILTVMFDMAVFIFGSFIIWQKLTAIHI